MVKIFVKLYLIIFPFTLFAQNFEEEFKKYSQQNQTAFNQYTEEIINNYDDYIKSIDANFTDYLKTIWEEFEVFKGINPSINPKPTEIPNYNDEPVKEDFEITKQISEYNNYYTPDLIIPESLEENNTETLKLELNFYGNQHSINYDKKFLSINLQTVDEDEISECWNKLIESNYGNFISQLVKIKLERNLNDWGYYMFVKNIMQSITNNDNNNSIVLTWFILNKSLYKIKLGYNNEKLYLLIPSFNTLYQTSYYTFDGITYYIPGFTGTKINTYKNNYPESNRLFSLYFDKPLNFTLNESDKLINYSFQGNQYQFHFKYNKNIINFYNDYPLTNLSVYFNAPISIYTKNSFQSNFRQIFKQMDQDQIVTFLLQFLQTSFEYKIDQEHLKKEKFYFPEEMFYFSYSDCEDRSILFAKLVSEFTKYDLIGVSFDDHVATGINLQKEISGDYIKYNSKKYMICDPTFLNAPIGRINSIYKNKQAEIILINEKEDLNKEKIWQNIANSGGKRGNKSYDIVFDEEGNYYVTGFYKGVLQLDDYKLTSKNNSNDIFIAKYDNSNNIIWTKSIGSNGNDISYCLNHDDKNNIYLFGQYEETLTYGELKIKPDEGFNTFVLKINSDGTPILLKNISIDTTNSENYFLAKLSKKNKMEWISYNYDNFSNNNFEIQIDLDKNIFISGLIPYLKNSDQIKKETIYYAQYSELNLVNMLIEEHKKLINKQYERTIAALYAAINLVTKENIILTGKIIQQAFEKSNPDFKNQNKELYENIGSIESIIKSNEGKIKINTENKKTVYLNNIEISNQALFSVTELNNGDALIDIYSGIKIGGQSLAWSIINYTKLLKQDGSVFIDYGNNYKTSMRIKPDIIN